MSLNPPPTITCVECRGTCHLISHTPDDGFQPGDWVAYRCPECLDRFDLQLVEEDADEEPSDAW
ncbi:hypothetical protein [Euzebya tangerina]|uniref:hypothetical protein n=1 Tax=Euzebya tangerina TaxID=591198 RepID=UPI0013C2C1A8|nr:hypothetical protein [Euzebya tangerina]